ncbi:hypothetical protein QQ045_027009 [Rhodiola kirilowii]
MSLLTYVGFLTEPKSWRSCICSIVPAVSLLCVLFFIGSAFIATDPKESYLRFTIPDVLKNIKADSCQSQCRPPGSEALPRGIVTTSSNLEMRPLWGFPVIISRLKREKKSSLVSRYRIEEQSVTVRIKRNPGHSVVSVQKAD